MRNSLLLCLGLICLVAVFAGQLLLGSVVIPADVVWRSVVNSSLEKSAWENIVIYSRLPAALAAMASGAALSVSGLQMQTMFRNPVAGPYVLGISSGAGLGVAAYLMSSSLIGLGNQAVSNWGIVFSSAIGSVVVFLVMLLLALRISNMIAVLIVGLMMGGGISAFIEILQSFSGSEALKQYVLWSFGSFRYVSIQQSVIMVGVVVLGLVFTFLLAKPLNLLLLGDVYALSSGLNLRTTKVLLVITTSLLVGTVTAFCGPIGFVGLAVPHLSRSLFKSADHKFLIPASAIIGSAITGVCNIVAALPGTDYILPINAVTALLGAPVVIWIILKQKRYE